ncbi:hypothetical protein SAMN05444169_8829 [Bradyrhizobium erythrophlei]|uniref:Uncharacterized protein n=1 Tax=Bradyrhizobium erythrophlei TaxID=1437360 RepID=A0A1M5V1U0_9BRAD|nr:hypothetical protein SAMN05444169_8829 [Bradyrhizobium erythrophlei]
MQIAGVRCSGFGERKKIKDMIETRRLPMFECFISYCMMRFA